MAVRTYDASQVVITVDGNPLSGFADGSFISIEREQESFTKVVGADGTTSRAKMNNRSGSVTLTLAQTSPSNDVLSALHERDGLNNDGVFPIIIKDLLGSSIMFSGTGWIVGLPRTDFAKEISNREWVIHISDMDFSVMGNVGVGV